eukprot:1141614-Pelagomonas_calceolata.AAC.3
MAVDEYEVIVPCPSLELWLPGNLMLSVSKSLLSGMLLVQPGPGVGNDAFLEMLGAWQQGFEVGKRCKQGAGRGQRRVPGGAVYFIAAVFKQRNGGTLGWLKSDLRLGFFWNAPPGFPSVLVLSGNVRHSAHRQWSGLEQCPSGLFPNVLVLSVNVRHSARMLSGDGLAETAPSGFPKRACAVWECEAQCTFAGQR